MHACQEERKKKEHFVSKDRKKKDLLIIIIQMDSNIFVFSLKKKEIIQCTIRVSIITIIPRHDEKKLEKKRAKEKNGGKKQNVAVKEKIAKY